MSDLDEYNEALMERDAAAAREARKVDHRQRGETLVAERDGVAYRLEGVRKRLAHIRDAAEGAQDPAARARAFAELADLEVDVERLTSRLDAIDTAIAQHRKARP